MSAASEEPGSSPKKKRGKIEMRPGQPLAFKEDAEASPQSSSEEPKPLAQVAKTIKAYRDAAKQFLSGKYKDLESFAPAHLRDNCNVTVIGCNNGLVVRYDVPTEGPAKVRSGSLEASLTELGPPLSDYLIHFPPDPASYDPGPHLPTMGLSKFSLTSSEVEHVSTVRLMIVGPLALPQGVVFPPPPHKPPCLISATNQMQVVMGGHIAPADADPADPRTATHEFVARGTVRLAVGWQAIEVYPGIDPAYWNPEHASLWAETDLLAAAAQRQFQDAQFAALDPYVAARKTLQHLIAQFTSLLEGPEEPLHQFLKEHPQLLCPAHTKVWSKLPLGDRVTDFVFRQPANEYLLVELESPLRDLFRKDGQQREELTHAFNQIVDWRVYIEDHLATVQDELGLTGISPNPDSLIVIGRSSSLSEDNRRKLTALQSQIPKLRIFTYEDMLQHAKAVGENLFGPLDITGTNVEIYYNPV